MSWRQQCVKSSPPKSRISYISRDLTQVGDVGTHRIHVPSSGITGIDLDLRWRMPDKKRGARRPRPRSNRRLDERLHLHVDVDVIDHGLTSARQRMPKLQICTALLKA